MTWLKSFIAFPTLHRSKYLIIRNDNIKKHGFSSSSENKWLDLEIGDRWIDKISYINSSKRSTGSQLEPIFSFKIRHSVGWKCSCNNFAHNFDIIHFQFSLWISKLIKICEFNKYPFKRHLTCKIFEVNFTCFLLIFIFII